MPAHSVLRPVGAAVSTARVGGRAPCRSRPPARTSPEGTAAPPIDTPPFLAYPLRPGITFTYLGVAVNERAQMLWQDDTVAPNIFAAGEIMAGNVLGKGYIAGIGMAIGTAFGRLAGREAARHVAG